MPEHAIIIPRVSTTQQAEENQLPALLAFAEAKGYTVDAVVPIHGKSAFHGRHLKYVRQAVETYVRQGAATVVIFRDVDRSSRQGAQATFDLRGEIIRAGGRMEFSGQEYLNDQRTQEMLLGILATAAREESSTKARRAEQGIDAAKRNGELVGRVPWGYDAAKVEGKRVLVPNALGRKWIPWIYQSAIEGVSLRTMTIKLKGVQSPKGDGTWSQDHVRWVIANPTYCGNRPSKGNMVYEALVTSEVWQQANMAVDSRNKQGRSTIKWEAALVKPLCGQCYGVKREGAPSGESPMYLNHDAKRGYDYHLYACKGHGRARRSCGAKTIPAATLDQAVNEIMAADGRPHWTLEYIPGDDNAEKLARLNDAIALAGRDGDYAKVAQLAAEAEQIRQQPHRKGRTERRETTLTVGQHWQTLSLTEKREELLKWTVIALPDKVRVLGPWRDDEGTVIGDMIAADSPGDAG